MLKRALFGIFAATVLPAVVCYILFQLYKAARESAAIQLLQTPSNFRADYITKNIYLGDYESSLQFSHLQQNNITHVVAVLNSVVLPPSAALSSNYKYLVIKAEDKYSENMIDTFPFVYDFIKNATENNSTVLVHCAKGASRSATLVIAYLMKERQISFMEAYNIVRKARSVVLPNKGFLAQLKKFNKIQKLSKKMVKKEEEEEKEANKADSGYKSDEDTDYENYTVNSGIPAIYTCTNGTCTYLHGNIFTDIFAEVSMSVRYVIQQILNKFNKK